MKPKSANRQDSAKQTAAQPGLTRTCLLTAALIVKDEEQHIARCLNSISKLADEIVLVDTGSSDRTLEIAQSLGLPNIKTGEFPWCNDFSAARNHALTLSSGQWILWIDADEELQPGGAAIIRKTLLEADDSVGGISIPIVSFTEEESDVETYTHAPVRLFRNHPAVRFTGRIHEQVLPGLKSAGLGTAVLSGTSLLHHGYRPSEMKSKDKASRFTRMLELEVKEHPDSGFQWFNLANALSVSRETTKQAHAAKMAVKTLDDNDPVLPLAYQLLASALIALGKPREALQILSDAKKRGIDGGFISFERANAYLMLGEFESALKAINHCMQFKWTEDTIGDQSMVLFKRHVVKGQILNGLCQWDEALKCFDQAMNVQPNFEPCIFHRSAALANIGRTDEAIEGFHSLTSSAELAFPARLLLARCHIRQANWTNAAKEFAEAFQVSPEEFTDWGLWAEAAEKSGDQEQIATAFTAFAAHPEPNHAVLINWGRCLADHGEYGKALECFSEALRLAPTDANACFNCGDLLYKLGQFQDAAHLYQAGLMADSENVSGWFVFGNTLAMLNAAEASEIAYAEVLKREPDHEGALHNLAVLKSA